MMDGGVEVVCVVFVLNVGVEGGLGVIVPGQPRAFKISVSDRPSDSF